VAMSRNNDDCNVDIETDGNSNPPPVNTSNGSVGEADPKILAPTTTSTN